MHRNLSKPGQFLGASEFEGGTRIHDSMRQPRQISGRGDGDNEKNEVNNADRLWALEASPMQS